MDTILIVVLVLLPFVNWPIAIHLITLARIKPHVRALTERALLAVIIAVVTTIYVVVNVNTSLDYPMFSFEVGRNLVRILVIAIGLSPVWWLWSYYFDGFRDR